MVKHKRVTIRVLDILIVALLLTIQVGAKPYMAELIDKFHKNNSENSQSDCNSNDDCNKNGKTG